MVIDVPIISADSHITEPPDTYTDRIDPALPRPGAATCVHDDKARRPLRHPGHDEAGADGPGGRRGQAGRGDHGARRRLRRPAPRRLGSRGPPRRAGPRRRRPARSSTRRSAWCSATTTTSTTSTRAWTPTTSGSPSTARAHPDRLFGVGQTAMRTPEEGIADLQRIKELGLRGRDDAGHPRRRGLRLARSTTRSTRPPSTSGCRCRSTSSPARRARSRGPKINGFLTIVRSCQDVMGTFVFGGVFERHPDLKRGVRRGRRRLGAALHVPHGPRLRAPPQLAAPRRRCTADAERVLPREHLRHVPGRLGRVQGDATS